MLEDGDKEVVRYYHEDVIRILNVKETLETKLSEAKAEIERLKKELFDVSDLSAQKSGHIEQLKVYRGLASSLNAKIEKLETVLVAADFYIKIDGSKDANKVWAARCGLRDKLDAAKEGL